MWFSVGVLVMAMLSWMNHRLYEGLMVLKSGRGLRVPMKIKGNMYYIIPEEEYVALELLRLRSETNDKRN